MHRGSRRDGRRLGMLIGAAASALAFPAAAEAAGDPSFTPVKPELFSAPGAFTSAWGDYDGDGDPDLVVGFKGGAVRLYRNDRGGFVDASARLGMKLASADVRSAAWADFDGDGRLDLYLTTRPRNYLFRNTGSGFQEVAEALGVDAPGVNGRQASFVDYDNDGDLDLFLADRSGANRLFRQAGGRFVNVASEVGLADVRKTVGACWFDFDADGDVDLFAANQGGDTDAFFRNDGGRFTDIAPQLGVHSPGRPAEDGGVGCTVGDYDNDGDPDLYLTAYGVSRLYRNEAGAFSDVAEAMGVAVRGHMVAASWGDYDNDGRLDLFVTGYTGEGAAARAADHLFRNTGDRFVDMLKPDHPANAADHSVQWADFDGDGDLDLSLAMGYPPNGRHPVLRNELAPPHRGRSLSVDVLDAAGRRTRAGAEVRAFDAKGSLLGARFATTGDGYDSQSDGPVHFGLQDAGPVTLEVTFLTSAGRKVVRLQGVKPGRVVRVRQPAGGSAEGAR